MRPLFSRNDWFIVVGVAALLLAVSLAVYSRKSLKWTGPDLLASANHYAMGVPPWLELNHFHLEPASQTIDLRSLPDTEKYSPRWRVQTMPLVASLIGCLVFSIMMVGVRRALCGRGGEEDGNRFLWGYGIGVLPGLALGAVAPTEPEWIGKLALALGVLPICVAIAAAVMRDYLRGVLLAFNVPVAIVWSQRIVDVFRSSHRVGGLPNADDLSVVVIFGAIYGLVAVTSTCVARFLHRTDKDAEQSLAAESRSCPAVLRIPWLRSAEGDRSPRCHMSTFNKSLAVLAGAAVTGSVAFSGHVASQFRKIFLDFDAELPAVTRALVDAPFLFYVAAGAILGALAAWGIWVAKSKVRALLIAVSVAVAVIVLWIGFAVSVMSPMVGVVHDLSEANPEMQGEQGNAADSR